MKLTNIATDSNSDKRVCERTDLQKEVSLSMTDGYEIECLSADVSLGGISLVCKDNQLPDLIGKNASLSIAESDISFDCIILRVNANQLAVEIDKKQAARFGMAITQNLFSR